MRRLMIAAVAGAVAAAGCARSDPEPAGGAGDGAVSEGAADSALVSSFNVQVESDSVRFTLMVMNATASPQVLEFASAQRMEFAVETVDGESVWQWSAERGFAQMLGADTVAAGGSREYTAAWSPGGRTGRHIAVGRVTSTNRPIELRTEFEIPER